MRTNTAILIAALFTTACGGGITITGTQLARGADATIDVGGMSGGSRLVELRASHLPPPGRLRDGMQHYALWVRKDGHSNLLAIMEYDEGSRQGYARGTTAYGSFQVMLTAERNRHPTEPSDAVIFRQNAD